MQNLPPKSEEELFALWLSVAESEVKIKKFKDKNIDLKQKLLEATNEIADL